MKLIEYKSHAQEFLAKGYRLPQYDREKVKAETYAAPEWLHFGAGNIFRAYQASLLEALLNKGSYGKGVIVAESFDYELLDKAYRPYDNLTLSVVMHADGSIEKQVIGAITESLKADQKETEDWIRLTDIFRNPSLQLVSFSITEKGYSVNEADLAAGFDTKLAMGKLTMLLFERFKEGMYPLTLQSMDNCSRNGDKVRDGVWAYADAWVKQGIVNPEFAEYVRDSELITYPWCMIDKITPRPNEKIAEMLRKDGFEDTDSLETARHSFTAPFVNAEEVGYLVIEDDYAGDRPPLEEAGVIFTDRETVDKVERMKVGTCLNPLHTALGTFGCLLGYTLVSAEMADADLNTLVNRIGYDEGMPVVVDPGIIDPKKFLDEVLTKRFPNKFMPDAPQRLVMDNSQKIPVRYGVTIREYLKRGTDLNTLTYIPLVFAGYARFLRGIDDCGNLFELSSDPLKDELMEIVKDLRVEEGEQDFICLRKLFTRADIFGADLYEAGLGEKLEGMVRELYAGPGAVRRTLHKYVTM